MKISDASNHYEILHHSPIIVKGQTEFSNSYIYPSEARSISYDGYYANIFDPDMPTMKVAFKTLRSTDELVELRCDPNDLIKTSCNYYHDISLLQNNYSEHFKDVANNCTDYIEIIDDARELAVWAKCYAIGSGKSGITINYEALNTNYDFMVEHRYTRTLGRAYYNSKPYGDVTWNQLCNDVTKHEVYYEKNDIMEKNSWAGAGGLFGYMTDCYFDPNKRDNLKQIETTMGGYTNAYDFMDYELNHETTIGGYTDAYGERNIEVGNKLSSSE